jgi:hypothetical protein
MWAGRVAIRRPVSALPGIPTIYFSVADVHGSPTFFLAMRGRQPMSNAPSEPGLLGRLRGPADQDEKIAFSSQSTFRDTVHLEIDGSR